MKLFALVMAGLLPVLGAAAPAPLVIDRAQSHIEIVVKATVDSFTGRLDAYEADIAAEGGQVTAATIRFRFADVRTGKDGRDEAMHEWQDTPKHPDGVFTLRSFAPTEVAGRLIAQGTLRFHDVTREIEFPVSITTDRTLYAIDGQAGINTQDFGLPIIRKLGLLKVDPLVKVRFHLQGTVTAGQPKTTPAP